MSRRKTITVKTSRKNDDNSNETFTFDKSSVEDSLDSPTRSPRSHTKTFKARRGTVSPGMQKKKTGLKAEMAIAENDL